MEHLHGTYSSPLVLLSILVSVLASYCALDVAGRVAALQSRAKTLWTGFGSVAMGLGIWSMHFIGMLAFRLPVRVSYDSTYLVISMILPVAAAWAGLWVIAGPAASRVKLVSGGLFMGLAIGGMHYSGMAAMRLPGQIHYDPAVFALSVIIAFAISFAALGLAYVSRDSNKPFTLEMKVGAALLMGAAIAGMHYTGMWAASFQIDPAALPAADSPMAPDSMLLAVMVTGTAFVLFLLLAVSQAMDRRYALRMAETSRRRYDSIFEHNPDMVCLFDVQGRIIRTNPAAERITGYSAETVANMPFTKLLSRKDSVKVREAFARVLQGSPQTLECTIRHLEGHDLLLSSTLVPLADGCSGKVTEIYTISKDITQQKRAERQLVQAKLGAERAARVKSEFLAIMSHEVRTPLNGVIAMAELLQEAGLTEEQREYAAIIGKSGKSLLTLINDVLDFAKMESGKMHLTLSPFSFRACLEDTLLLFKPQIQHQRISLDWRVEERVPELLLGDEGRLKQVLVNLIGNAVKFTEAGAVEITVRQRLREGHELELECAVRDTGAGIPQEQLGHLFQPFYQWDVSARKHGGTGLGLAISKKLVELMDGTIRAESAEGRGSAFIFTFRVRCLEECAAAQG